MARICIVWFAKTWMYQFRELFNWKCIWLVWSILELHTAEMAKNLTKCGILELHTAEMAKI
jgi:hypothetical protein